MSAERPVIDVILGSTREGRRGERVWRWLLDHGADRDDLELRPVDLLEWDLPLLSAAKAPSRGEYEDPAQIRWGAHVAEADGFLLVTPEYNHGYPAPLKNALDTVFAEWRRKPVAFATYGGAGGGIRAAQQLTEVAVELSMVPLRSRVTIPRVFTAFGEDGLPKDERLPDAATRVFDDLRWWGSLLAGAR